MLGTLGTAGTRSGKHPSTPHPQGGLHRSPPGVRTLDSLSDVEWAEDLKRRLDAFIAEQRECAGQRDVAW